MPITINATVNGWSISMVLTTKPTELVKIVIKIVLVRLNTVSINGYLHKFVYYFYWRTSILRNNCTSRNY